MRATGARVARTAKTTAIAAAGLVGCLAIALAAGCAAVPSQRPAPRHVPLPEPYLSRVAAVQPLPAADEILDLTPDMLGYLETHIDDSRFRAHKVRSLSRLLLHPGLLGIDYDARRTSTAAETFRSRTGNCLSLSILFVAMARELGLDARFQQVEVVPQWDMEGDVLFAARHVNVYGHLRGWGDYVMDFYPFPEEPRGRRRILTDGEAIGQFYNNLGAARLAAGDYAGAWVYFRAAIREAPGWSDTWSNLGLVYQRVGDARSAEDMLRHALALEPDNTSAINNLAVLLHREGRDEEAGAWLDEIQRVRESNPYYYYALAREAQAAGDYDRALSHIEHAMRMKREESLFRRKAAEIVQLLEDEGTGEAYRTTGGGRAASGEPEPAIL